MIGRARPAVALAALLAVAAAMVLLRWLIDRPPGGAAALAWPAPAWAPYRAQAIAAGAIVGAALAVAGGLLQSLLRNPLASPFILGVSGGAGLGVMIQLAVLHFTRGGAEASAGAAGLPAIAGALAALGIVYALSQRGGWLDPISMVLIGVVVSTIAGAGIMFCQHLVPTGVRGEFTTWLMGHVPEAPGARTLAVTGAVTVAGLVVAVALGRAMDAATLGDDEARSVGVPLGPLRVGLFILAGVLTALSVALAGPIGFVGLIAPHAARLVVGPRHATMLLGAALVGVVIVVGADAGRQAIDVGAGRMPVGIFTALLGGPVFIWLLLSGRGRA